MSEEKKDDPQVCALCNRETDMAVRHPEGRVLCAPCARMGGKAVERMDEQNRSAVEQHQRENAAMHIALISAYVTAELIKSGPQHVLANPLMARAVQFANRALTPTEEVH